MSQIFIRARSDGKVYSVDAAKIKLEAGDFVIFETEQNQEIARVINKEEGESFCAAGDKIEEKADIIRRLNDKDMAIDEERKSEARRNLERCQEIVKKHNLPMDVLDADLSFDEKKLTFYFSAPGRVDFRALVSELASTFQKLIRLQQVGARDRARYAGGIGRCGQDLCCKKFLKGELECVSMDMAYTQNLGQMGSNRVTGACGKLMCCLKYELDFYHQAKEKLPAIGSEIKTEKGKGTVINQSILENKVTVELPDKTFLEVNC